VLALMTASFGVGQIVGPIAAGMLAERSGSFFLPSLAAAAVLMMSGLIVWSATGKCSADGAGRGLRQCRG